MKMSMIIAIGIGMSMAVLSEIVKVVKEVVKIKISVLLGPGAKRRASFAIILFPLLIIG